jgi:predicted MPP superfamily phosphohydrolase
MQSSISSSASEEQPATATPAAGRRSRTPWRILRFVLTWMTTCWLVIGALLSPVLPGGWLAALALALLSASPLLALARWFGGSAAPSATARLWVIRPFWYTQLLLPLLAIAGLLGALLGLPFGASGSAGRLAMALVALVYGGGVLAGYIGARWLVVRHLAVRLPQLPSHLEGLRIAQVSDLHVGPHTSRRHLAKIVSAIQAGKPDLIAVTGDQVDDYAADVAHFAAAFGALTAPLGVFAIAGNHDVYAGWDGVRAGMEAMGMTVLVNAAVAVEHNGGSLWIAATGDPAGTYVQRDGEHVAPDIARTLADIPAGAFTLALAHNPSLWPALAQQGVPLTLSGHTHHGQFSIPRLGWSMASPFLEHAMGHYREANSLLYINPGTNYWGIPFRIGALPEVTVLVLQSASDDAAAIISAPRA